MPALKHFNVQPDSDHVVPGLKIVVALRITLSKETVLSISGRLHAADDRVLCVLEEARIKDPVNTTITAVRSSQTERMSDMFVEFFAPLSPAALTYIDKQRRRVVPNDVTFKIEVWGQALSPSGTPLFTVSHSGQGAQLVAVEPTQKSGHWVLLQDEPTSGFLRCETFAFSSLETIHASNWAAHFAPKLGLGSFVFVELPQPPAPNGTTIDDQLAAALRDLDRARTALLAGDDDDAIRALRRPADTLRGSLGQIESLLTADGYPSDAASSYAKMIREQFELCSKFLHTTDKGGKTLRPEVHAKHEDVLFVFSACVNALNVVVRKGLRQTAP